MPSKITDEFPNDIYKNILLDFIDSIPIDGQAQLIKTAAYDYNEDFMVIKGDIITSIDLNIAMEHHKMLSLIHIYREKMLMNFYVKRVKTGRRYLQN